MTRKVSAPKFTLEEILHTLKRHLPDLEKGYGVKSMGIFGSYARGETRSRSDLDLLVEFNGRRFVRDYPRAKKLKQIYGNSCQVCGCTVATFEGVHYDNQGYAEVHHIRSLGSGHDGPDHASNMLVLCPNHHAAFDLSTMALNPDSLEVYYLERDGGLKKQRSLSLHESEHDFDPDCLRYAWELWLRKLRENGVDISQAELDWS